MTENSLTERTQPLGGSGYLQSRDQVELFYRFWAPQGPPQILLLALHGLAAHGEWYESLAGALLPRGIATLAPDLRGQGLTRWDLGKLPGPALLLEDARVCVEALQERFPGVPVFCLGTSLGGCLAALLAAECPDLSGLILLSPSFQPTYIDWKEKARMSLSLLFGREGGAATPLGRGLPICGDRLRLQWLTQDPLALGWMPALSHWNAQRLIQRSRGALGRIRVPVLCVQGDLDPVTSADANRLLWEKRAGARFVLWEGASHELASEADSEYLSGLLADWMRHQSAQRG